MVGRSIRQLYVEEMNNPNASGTDKRAYQLQNIEKYRPTGKGSHNNASPISPALTGIGYTVSDLAQYVNRKDLDYSPRNNSTKNTWKRLSGEIWTLHRGW